MNRQQQFISTSICPSIIFAFLFFGLAAAQLQAQRNYDLFWLGFSDKAQSAHSIFRPQDYLSPRSIARRQRQNILIDSTDLPVSAQYLKILRDKNIRIHGVSRWFNGAIVVAQQAQIDSLQKQNPFIKEALSIGFSREVTKPEAIGRRNTDGNFRKNIDFYGTGSNQIKMLNGQYLHAMGLRGDGVQIAVFDGGFINLRETPTFYHLFERNLVLGTHDFVEGDDFVYESDDHGRDVASCMAANIPNLFVGTAPDASYYFFKTEDGNSELIGEEYYWLLAAEYADSIGVDIINSSLGYAQFDDKTMSHAYVDLDGKTTPISRAAAFASQKGVIVVTSAGNEGSEKWKHITAPGDVPNILTVGAVDRDGYYANLSSVGFANRDYIKPDVAARGLQAVVATKFNYDTRYNSGTSFSSPIMAGMVASLQQAVPHCTSLEIMAAIRASADQSDKPDYKKGYGIPDFLRAYKLLSPTVLEVDARSDKNYLQAPKDGRRLDILFQNTEGLSSIEISLLNPLGEIISAENLVLVRGAVPYATIPNWAELPTGVYYLYLRFGKITKRMLICR